MCITSIKSHALRLRCPHRAVDYGNLWTSVFTVQLLDQCIRTSPLYPFCSRLISISPFEGIQIASVVCWDDLSVPLSVSVFTPLGGDERCVTLVGSIPVQLRSSKTQGTSGADGVLLRPSGSLLPLLDLRPDSSSRPPSLGVSARPGPALSSIFGTLRMSDWAVFVLLRTTSGLS